MPLQITDCVAIPNEEIELIPMRASGKGGQHVNKVSTAIHLKFSISDSSLPPVYKERLLALKDKRITKEGVIVIKAQSSRSQERNKEDALTRLKELILSIRFIAKKRVDTKPTKRAQVRRVDDKKHHAKIKHMRKRVDQE